MTQLLVRNITSETLDSLKNKAKLNHRSLQGEIKHILDEAANTGNSNASSWPAGFLEYVIGGWQGEAFTRPEQGDYDLRDELK